MPPDRRTRWLLGLALAALAQTPLVRALDQTSPAPASPLLRPVELTAEQDHRRLMDLLRITAIRPGADPRDPNAPNAVNYDEAALKPYTLPDPLRTKDGRPVTTPKMWWTKRRPEIVEDFDREVYGRVPTQTPAVRWEVQSTTRETKDDTPVIVKELVGHVDNSSCPAISVDLELTLTVPATATGPVPIVLELGFAHGFPGMRPRQPGGPVLPPSPPGASWQRQLLAKNWGYAILLPTSVQADNGAGLTQGIIGLVNKGQPRNVDDWGALRAWAWGASRALDYLETDDTIDAKQVAVEGLSRYGKAALVAMAYDQRFAIGLIGSSGEGGAKLHRRNFGELVENLAGTGAYHWVAGNFIKYAGPLTPNDLPIDAHELIALCAPRPVFISAGSPNVEGSWIDQKGMFLAEVAAGPVYRLLGAKDLGTSEYPPEGAALIDGDLAFRQHSGGHTTGPNWPTFLEWASRYVKAPPLAAPPSSAQAKVALTFDDLPAHGPLPAGQTRAEIVKRLIAALHTANVPPVHGFVNAGSLDDGAEMTDVLRLWRDAGFLLGNHTFSHMDLDANSAAAFEAEIRADEPTLQEHMGSADWHWFRYPYLHKGATPEKRDAVAAYLKQNGYKVAEVTLSFDDWAYSDPYARCVAKGDQGAVDWMKETYLAQASERIALAQRASQQVYGREIPYVLLLHVGGFQALTLPALLDLLKQRGFVFVTLEEAEGDAAYASARDSVSGPGDTSLQRMMATARPTAPPPAEDVLARLQTLCR